MRRITALLCLALAALAPAPAARGASDPVRSLERALAATRDLEASFVQTRRSPLLPGVERSTGTLLIKKPGHARVEYRDPTPLVIWKRADSVWVYAPALRQVVVSASGAAGVPVGWVLGASLADIRRDAEVRAAGAGVEIRPRESAGLPWTSVKVGFGRDGFPNRYDFVDGSGERVTIELRAVKRNRGVGDARLRPRYPAGTRVVDAGS